MVVSQSPAVGESQVDGYLEDLFGPKKGRTNQPKSQHKSQGAAGVQTVTYSFFGSGGFFFFRFLPCSFFLSRGNTFLIVTTTKFGMSWSFSFGRFFFWGAGDVDFMDFCPFSSQKKLPGDSHGMLPSCPRHVSSIFSEVTHGNSGGWSFGTCSEVRDHLHGTHLGIFQQANVAGDFEFFFLAKSGKVWVGPVSYNMTPWKMAPAQAL